MFSRPKGIENTRIWVDGCFDFAHHGHAGAMLQARQLGKELYVGVHSDEEILLNKGPTVMNLAERIKAVDACKWSTKAVADAPYVTDPEFMKQQGCKYVVHGDDITTDANGNDCYQEVKDLGLFVVVKRTPNILTTDLVGRMLLMTTNHHFVPYKPSQNQPHPHPLFDKKDNIERFKLYATDETGLKPGSSVKIYDPLQKDIHEIVAASSANVDTYKNGIYYIDGVFDLFHPGHIEVLRIVKEKAEKDGYAVVVGIHDDHTVNQEKGLNYPIMNLFERSLCVLQCRYVDGVILQAPYSPDLEYLEKLPGPVKGVFHSLHEINDSKGTDPYAAVKSAGIFHEIGHHEYDTVTTEVIVQRVLDNKAAYEERQRKKGWKAEHEVKLREAEKKREQQ